MNSTSTTPNCVNPQLYMRSLIESVSETLGIACSYHGDGQVARLQLGEKVKLIQGSVIPVNSSSSAAVSKDKAACSDILKAAKIPHIRHRIFLNPALGDWTPKSGSWPSIHEYGKKHNYNLVCKPKGEGKGKEIQQVTIARDLEKVVGEMFSANRDIVICSYKPYQNEYSVLIYNNRVELILKRTIPRIIGDGKKSVSELIKEFLFTMEAKGKKEIIGFISSDLLFSNEILPLGNEIPLNWKHNGSGATTEIVPGEIDHKMVEIALEAARVVGIRFATVDIAHFPNDPKGKIFRVVEINPAPVLNHPSDGNRDLKVTFVFNLYTRIIGDLFSGFERKKGQASLSGLKVIVPEIDLSQLKGHMLAYIVSQIAAANGWKSAKYSQGWIMHLSKADKVRIVFGYTLPLNSSANGKVCSNKGLASSILDAEKIPQIRHHPLTLSDPGELQDNAWSKVLNYGSRHDYQVVCKPAEGTAGIDVERSKTPQELAAAVTKLFKTHANLVFCSFKKIHFEYRLIMLDGEAEIIFRKVPPFVVGDGVQTVQQLAANHLKEMDPKRRAKLIAGMNTEILVSDTVAPPGEKVYLHWKHNLGQGALCELVGGKSYREVMGRKEREEGEQDLAKMVDIAKRAVKVLDVRFVSVDIVEVVGETELDKQYRVMEINSGVMMDNLMEQHGPEGVKLATTVYAKALGISLYEED